MSLSLFICGISLHANEATRASQASRQMEAHKLVASTILAALLKKSRAQPGISGEKLADYGNRLLLRMGFNYDFDLCDFLRTHEHAEIASNSLPTAGTYLLPLTQTNGQRIRFQAEFNEDVGALCGECFFEIPALRVTSSEMLVVSEGRHYLLKRPSGFQLDEMNLVDSTMRRVLRAWHVPYGTTPVGVSADGTKLYLDTGYDEENINKLVLEISESGSLHFRARNRVNLGTGRDIERHPTDPNNAYLSFMRFRVGGKNYIIRYSAPCT